MKKSTIVHLNHSKFFLTVSQNASLFSFVGLFIVAFLLGCLLYSTGRTEKICAEIFKLFISSKNISSFGNVFFSSFAISFAFLFLIFLSGASLFGVGFIPFLVFIRGTLLGICTSGLYCNYGLTGIVYNLLIVIPATCISSLILIIAARYSLQLSFILGKMLLSEGQVLSGINIKKYLIYFALFLLITLFSSLLDASFVFAFKDFLRLG